MDHVGTFVALFLCALTSAANGATYYYKPANLSEDSLVNTRTILDVSRSLCAALCSASSCDSYRFGNFNVPCTNVSFFSSSIARCGSDSEQRLCQLGNYEHDAGTIYLAGGFTTFLGLKVKVQTVSLLKGVPTKCFALLKHFQSSVDACFGMMPRAANHYQASCRHISKKNSINNSTCAMPQVEEICGRLSGSFPEPRTQGQVDRLADIVGEKMVFFNAENVRIFFYALQFKVNKALLLDLWHGAWHTKGFEDVIKQMAYTLKNNYAWRISKKIFRYLKIKKTNIFPGHFGKRIGFKEDGSMPGVYRWESDGTVVPWWAKRQFIIEKNKHICLLFLGGEPLCRVVNGAHAQGCGRLQPDGRFHRWNIAPHRGGSHVPAFSLLFSRRMQCGGSGMPFSCQFC